MKVIMNIPVDETSIQHQRELAMDDEGTNSSGRGTMLGKSAGRDANDKGGNSSS